MSIEEQIPPLEEILASWKETLGKRVARCLFWRPLNPVPIMRTMRACLLAFALTACAPKSLQNEFDSTNAYFESHGKPEFKFSQQGRLTVRYLETGDVSKPTVVFIHGTPGGWSSFAGYINEPSLQQQAHLIAFDRPGWGGSVFSDGKFEPGIEAQSRLLKNWLCELSANSANGRLILVGHSLGGTLAPRLAMDHPDCVSAMLILAGPMDPDLSSPRWYNHAARVPPFGWVDWSTGVGPRQVYEQ